MPRCVDCLDCHFEHEETEIFPYLSPFEQRWLLQEHATLRARGFPPADVLRHARIEDRIFARRLPPAMSAANMADHARIASSLY